MIFLKFYSLIYLTIGLLGGIYEGIKEKDYSYIIFAIFVLTPIFIYVIVN